MTLMEYRQLGNSGVRVSAIGLGTNQFGGKVDQAGVNNIIDAALDLGVNLIDTADVYTRGRSEETLGIALQGKWDRVVLATKVFGVTGEGTNDTGASRYHIMNGVEASLRRLKSDHIDLYQIHRWDANTPIEETLRALDDLVRAGKVRYIGASNHASWLLTKALWISDRHNLARYDSIQPHYNLIHRREVEPDLAALCLDQGIGMIPYSPLAGGFLTGKYTRDHVPEGSRGMTSITHVQRYMTDANYDKVEALSAWATERGHTMAELAHAWLLAHPQVSSVICATRVEQVVANAKSAGWKWTAEELEEVNAVLDSSATQ